MLRDKVLAISIFSLSVSIIISASIISKEIRNNGQKLNSSLNMMSVGLNKISNSVGYKNNSLENNSYNPAEAAEYLGVSVSSLLRWQTAGALPCIRTFGGARRFKVSDLDIFLISTTSITSSSIRI